MCRPVLETDPKEQVGRATKMIHLLLPTTPRILYDKTAETEVSTNHSSHLVTNKNLECLEYTEIETAPKITPDLTRDSNLETKKYVLPPRSTRGVPPKRYDPEYESQRSKYPISKTNEGCLSQVSMTFNAALYSEDIPTTAEEALKSAKWRKAIEDEIHALNRNNTWEKCVLPMGKRPVGSRWVFTLHHKIQSRWNNRKVQGMFSSKRVYSNRWN